MVSLKPASQMTYFNAPSRLLFLRADNSSNTNNKGNVHGHCCHGRVLLLYEDRRLAE